MKTDVLTIHDRIVDLIPANPLSAALNQSMMQLVMFSIFIGVALVRLNPLHARPLMDLARAVRELSMVIVGWAMLLAPVAVLGLLTQITMQVGMDAILGISAYVGTVLLGLVLLIVLYLVLVRFVGKITHLYFCRM